MKKREIVFGLRTEQQQTTSVHDKFRFGRSYSIIKPGILYIRRPYSKCNSQQLISGSCPFLQHIETAPFQHKLARS